MACARQAGDGLYPNSATANRLLAACIEQGRLDVARQVRLQLAGRALKWDPDVQRQLDAAGDASTLPPASPKPDKPRPE